MLSEYPLNKETLKIAQRVLKIFAGYEFHIMSEDCTSDWFFNLRHQTIPQAGIFVNLKNPDKFTFSGLWPSAPGFGMFVPNETKDATVSRSKADDLIQKDVRRRFLDWYYPEFQIQTDRMKRFLDDELSKKNAKKELSDLLEVNLSTLRSDTIRPGSYGIREIQINHNASEVMFSTTFMPLDVAKEVFELLKRKMTPDNERA